MLSLSQILFTALVIVVVWQASRFMGRKGANQNGRDTVRGNARNKSRNPENARQPATQDMEKCPHCGVYHAEGLSHRCES
ncbi:hypothetical protein [Thalassospira marina]|uniref:Uncharacterized protein n=1 Tax=Thalassospira marina TaxID=2048283 RepID=A0A2N3KWL9_9PROT|nr:hypothetical protein [Thalassospira marina]AUG53726.1 hypothetical protein CSC3H3_14130 [Thalassospira marina]PKR54873.1 hypothetical protein COO20_05570 [Thalassospira marina]